MFKRTYKIVVDLIHPDGTFETQVVRSDMTDYTEVQREIAKIANSTNPLYGSASASPRCEPHMAVLA